MAMAKKQPEPVDEEPVEIDTRVRAGPVPNEIIQQARAGLKTELFQDRYCDEPSLGGVRRRRHVRNDRFKPELIHEYRLEDLFQHDKSGWLPIHYAVLNGQVEPVVTMLSEVPVLVNLPTLDDMQTFPILLAVMTNNVEMIELLLDFQADYSVVDWYYHGIVELCAFKQYLSTLIHFVDRDLPDLPVWKRLIDMVRTNKNTDAIAITSTLKTLLDRPDDRSINVNWRSAYDNGFAEAITDMIGNAEICDQAKEQAFDALLLVIGVLDVKIAAVEAGILSHLLNHLQSKNATLVRQSADTLTSLFHLPEYQRRAVELGVISALTIAMKNRTGRDSLISVIRALKKLVRKTVDYQNELRTDRDTIKTMIGLYPTSNSRQLLETLTVAVSDSVRRNEQNQNSFVQNGVWKHIARLMTVKVKSLVLAAIECVHALCENNPTTQRQLLQSGVVNFLLLLMKRTRYTSIQERTGGALWAMAGENIEERLLMAERITICILGEFVDSSSLLLNVIGSEGLYSMVSAPLGQHVKLIQGGAVVRLMKLIQRPLPPAGKVHFVAGRRVRPQDVLLAALRALRASCVVAGFVRFAASQELVCEDVYEFLPVLVGFVNDRQTSAVVRAEACRTLAFVTLGNKQAYKHVMKLPGFNLSVVLKLFNEATDPAIQLVYGSALAAFAYNSIFRQKQISVSSAAAAAAVAGATDRLNRMTFAYYQQMTEAKDEMLKAHAAHQMVVLCRCFPDNKPAESACHGIKVLVQVIRATKSNVVKIAVSDYIACLSHTRPGLPDAFVAVDVVLLLNPLLVDNREHIRGYAAIALGYLSYNPTAKRQIINFCRTDPVAYQVLKFYTRDNKLSPGLPEDWQHYVIMGLPRADPERRKQLVRHLPVQVFDEARPMMLTGDDDRGLEPEHDEKEGDEIEFPMEGTGGLLGKIKAKRPIHRPESEMAESLASTDKGFHETSNQLTASVSGAALN